MRNKYRVLSIILAVVLTVGTVIPATFFAITDADYIDEDCSVKNTYDEENITYSVNESQVDGKTVYETVQNAVGADEYSLARHGKFAEKVGVGDSNAIRFYEVRGASETDKDVSYLRILSEENSNYNWFVPEAYSKYAVNISYKSEKSYKFILCEVGSFGEISYEDKKLAVFSDVADSDGWTIATAEFTVLDNPTSLYIAVVTENGECDNDAEVYIDNVAVMLPEAVENPNAAKYTSTLNVDGLDADGWKASFSSNPQGGVAFTDKSKVGDLYESWGKGAANITRRQGQKEAINGYNNWNNSGTFSNMGALTYTARKYKYFTLTVEYKYENNSRPRPIVSFNQQNTTPEMFYKTSNYVTNPTYAEEPIGVYFEYEGHTNISGKMTGTTRKPASPSLVGTQWHKAEIKVTPGQVSVVVYNDDGTKVVEASTTLSADYEGGYISLMQNGINFFRNISITEIEIPAEAVDSTYTSDFKNVGNLELDGWTAAFSANPQSGVAFTDKEKISDLYECWDGGFTRRQVNINWYNNWDNASVFSNMAALTYTAQKYKYFTMTVEYKYGKKNSSDTKYKNYPRPIITFNQQNTTPEMFYKTSTAVPEPTYGEDPIGVFFEYEGAINISGKKIQTARKAASPSIEGGEWHKVEITVIPDQIYVAIYNSDGTVANENTIPLDEGYEGGYISLMQNGLSFFRNVSITGYSVVDMAQNETNETISVDLDEAQTANTVLVSTKANRWYDFNSVSAVSENGISYKVSKFGTDLYKIEKAEPLRINVSYGKRKLDYDPEYTIKYYFDWDAELDDFTATKSPHAEEAPLEEVKVSDIWKISDNVLTKPTIDLTGTTNTSGYFADFNILMLKDIKFRNFELTLEYKHGKSGGLAGGIIFGINDPTVFCKEKNAGIFATVESDGRGTLYGKDLRNAELKLQAGEGVISIPGYPQWDTKQIHTMKLKVLDGKVEMIIDDANTDDPVVGVIPQDYYGYIALAVGNNKGWFNNLTIQPLDEWGNKITLKENEKQSKFNPQDIETDTWVDNSEWD